VLAKVGAHAQARLSVVCDFGVLVLHRLHDLPAHCAEPREPRGWVSPHLPPSITKRRSRNERKELAVQLKGSSVGR